MPLVRLRFLANKENSRCSLASNLTFITCTNCKMMKEILISGQALQQTYIIHTKIQITTRELWNHIFVSGTRHMLLWLKFSGLFWRRRASQVVVISWWHYFRRDINLCQYFFFFYNFCHYQQQHVSPFDKFSGRNYLSNVCQEKL